MPRRARNHGLQNASLCQSDLEQKSVSAWSNGDEGRSCFDKPLWFYQTYVCGGEAVWDRDDSVSDLLFLVSNLQVDIGDSKTSKRSYVPGWHKGDERERVRGFSSKQFRDKTYLIWIRRASQGHACGSTSTITSCLSV